MVGLRRWEGPSIAGGGLPSPTESGEKRRGGGRAWVCAAPLLVVEKRLFSLRVGGHSPK